MQWANIWTKRPYSPFIMSKVVEATVSGLAKLFPKSSITCGGLYWDKGVGNYFYPQKELTKTADDLFKQSFKSPEFLYNFFKTAFEKAKELREFSEPYLRAKLSNKSSEELLSYLDEFSKKFYRMYSYATVAILIGYQPENPLYKKMDKIIRQKTKKEPEKLADYLAILTNPPKRLKTNDQELAILRLAVKAKKQGLKREKDITNNFSQELSLIKKEFEWLFFDLCDTISRDIKFYAKLIKEKVDLKIEEIEQKIKSIENYEEITASEFNKLSKKLSLSAEERKVFELIRNLGYYKLARAHEFIKAFYNFRLVQDELGQHAGLSTLESKYLLAEEFKQALDKPKEYKQKVRRRLKNLLILIYKDKKIVLDGDEAKQEYLNLKFAKEKIKLKEKKLSGMPAQSGKARGRVKIINTTKELAKMKKGNILVSAATNPNLLSGMKKAAAIITDEGGITCHAAIVSRELGIPCVVGTKVATKVLKDGDLVEVDANKGIVRKIDTTKGTIKK